LNLELVEDKPDMSNSTISKLPVLVIDDEEPIRNILCEALSDNYETEGVSSAEEGLEKLRSSEIALVLSDINMPGISGLEMVPQIMALSPETVVIMMSGLQTLETAIQAMRVGAFDYLTKPFDLRHVEAAVKRACEHYELKIAKRKYDSQLEQMVEQRTAALRKTTEELEQQIAERNRAEERLEQLAYYDVLTELPNRMLFKDRITQALNVAQQEHQMLAVLLLSVDNLKNVNDTLGQSLADQLICQVAERLNECMREGDTLAYWGSDEFAFLFRQLESADDAIQIAERIQSNLDKPFGLEAHEVYVTPSIGIALSPMNGSDEETLMKNVGAALFQAKQRGGNNYEFYTVGMNAKALRRLSLESRLRRAIEREEFMVYYQPKVDTNSWNIVGAEGLIRWQDPDRGLVSPGEFIPLAEDTGLITNIDAWCLRHACEQIKRWNRNLPTKLSLSTNISARGFQDSQFFSSVTNMLQEVGLAAEYLELELTESSIMTNPTLAVRTLTALKTAGIKISVDDFGTGFSSLSYLKRLPIDTLKLDRSFVIEATVDPDDAALVMAIVTLAHNLRLKVVAEGVETEEQLRFLHLLRCDQIQGYLFSKPLPAEDFEKLLFQGQFIAEPWRSLRERQRITTEKKQLTNAA
jgi:diguanylate cyclase (GGDEF)-like protein